MLEARAFQTFLKKRLVDQRWSVIRLSQETGISDAVIYRWLRADRPKRPSDANLKRLVAALDTPYEELLKLAGYLPGEASIEEEDGDLAATIAETRAGWPHWDEGFRRAVRTLVSAGGWRVNDRMSAELAHA